MKRVLLMTLCLFTGSLLFSQFDNSQYFKWGVTGNFHKGSIVLCTMFLLVNTVAALAYLQI